AAVRSVPLDWQGPVGSYRAATSVAAGVARQPGVAEAVPTATAPFAGLEHTSPTVGTIRSGAGSILAVPPRYLTHLHTFRLLRGSQRPGPRGSSPPRSGRSEEHTSELQSPYDLVCRLLLEKKKKNRNKQM